MGFAFVVDAARLSTIADPETPVFASDDELKKLLAAWALTRLGVDNVSVYDGSMTEWAADPSLPIEVD